MVLWALSYGLLSRPDFCNQDKLCDEKKVLFVTKFVESNNCQSKTYSTFNGLNLFTDNETNFTFLKTSSLLRFHFRRLEEVPGNNWQSVCLSTPLPFHLQFISFLLFYVPCISQSDMSSLNDGLLLSKPRMTTALWWSYPGSSCSFIRNNLAFTDETLRQLFA